MIEKNLLLLQSVFCFAAGIFLLALARKIKADKVWTIKEQEDFEKAQRIIRRIFRKPREATVV